MGRNRVSPKFYTVKKRPKVLQILMGGAKCARFGDPA